ncbi:bifunctional chorismate mutase/prephenate dehydratase [Helicobacter sp. MIT 14-3879]|uniref:bifunctional chorismate mutase/prephenate dehydratase n=1 Tax=Helicobacter sp. MIT 14-3879 TaxID=2040649 RepID=UPI000E1FA01C|nr:bifunctional chorismate mutase/prephenate dehydratase [Helicobacter sp. MIT 14-3879]RDU65162.1 chloride transporter [Helicobacter sp. MIT 14-3879]
MANNLNNLRDEIDLIDNEILKLLDKRMGIVKEIGYLKLQSNTAIYHPKREQEIIKRLVESSRVNITSSGIKAIYQEIFATSRYLELPERVSYLGPIGSFTHQVAVNRFGQISEYISSINIESIIKSVANKSVKYGVIPIENNNNGIVGESLDFLAKYDVKIVSESNLPIHHSFASNEKLVSNIKKIYSKDIAFGQCREFLNNYSLKNAELIPLDSTAKAASIASIEPNSAAICSNIAASLFNLPIMFENIQDSNDNITRFFIISDFKTNISNNDKTSFCAFINDSNKPGALANLLNDFSKKNINLVKLESRPIHNTKGFSYWFYIELEGHIDESSIKEIFEEKQDKLKWLGSYPKDII